MKNGQRIEDGAIEALIARYRDWLVLERGVADTTVKGYLSTARLFLAEFPDIGRVPLSLGDVNRFVVSQCRSRKPGAARSMVTNLRSPLRWFHISGVIDRDLASATPAPTHWRSGLPRALPPDQVVALVNAAGRDTSVQGRRDRALLLLMARLGLRAREAARLTLDDIDWTQGEIVTRGKADRTERLPLPVDVGEAIADYLERGRPTTSSRYVFIRSKGSQTCLSSGGVYHVVERMCLSAAIPRVGPHQLRHSAATALLRAGATLDDVGQVLRHRSWLTTLAYTKIDVERLTSIALPWPGAPA
jgi:integrase/recombinase XerD